MRQVFLLPFVGKKMEVQKFGNLPKPTQLGSDGARIQTWQKDARGLFNHAMLTLP